MASFILNDKWYSERKDSVADDAVRIVVAAAKLLVAAIKETNFLTAVYPSSNDILSSGRCIQTVDARPAASVCSGIDKE